MINLSRRAAVAGVAAMTMLSLAACSASNGGASSAPAHHHAASPSTSHGSSSAAPRKHHRIPNPLTGRGIYSHHPVVAVKIDDTAPGRPQVGIDKADIVYLEAAEAGLTRLAAVFASTLPSQVGYVRSTRPSDPELLSQFGRITEAFSGGQDVSRSIARQARFKLWNLGAGKPYFHRVDRPESTYINVILNLADVGKHVHTARPHSIGWHFARSLGSIATGAGTDVRTTVTGVYPVADGTPVEFRWNAKAHRYIRYIDGAAQHAADGNAVSAVNVVVQSCNVHSFTADRDVNGNPAQFTTTVGSGPVSVFRQGKRITGTWSRSKESGGTSLRTKNGRTIPLEPGNTWVVLVRKGVPVRG